jgi:hypothetical protein
MMPVLECFSTGDMDGIMRLCLSFSAAESGSEATPALVALSKFHASVILCAFSSRLLYAWGLVFWRLVQFLVAWLASANHLWAPQEGPGPRLTRVLP